MTPLEQQILASLRDDPPESLTEGEYEGAGWRCGFDMARRVRRILAEHGVDPPAFPEAFEAIINEVASIFDREPDEVFGRFCLAWDRVRLPEGQDALTVAWAQAVTSPDVLDEGDWPSASMGNLCAAIATTARILSEGNGKAFLPCRRIADLSGRHFTVVARAVKLLQERHIISEVEAHTQHRAARYVFSRATESLSLRGNGCLRGSRDIECPNSEAEPGPAPSETASTSKRRKTADREAVAAFDRRWPKGTPLETAHQIAGEIMGDGVDAELWTIYPPNIVREALRHAVWAEAVGRTVEPLQAYCEEHSKAQAR